MRDDSLKNPHDHFFRHSFSLPDIAQPFFQRYLPPEIRDGLDLTTLRPEPESFVDPKLADHHADLLFSVRRHDGRPARLFLLLEHKSYDTAWAGLQLLDYMVRIWYREQTRIKSPPLPPVIGLVLYHGEAPWSGGSRFEPLVDAPEGLGAFTPNFRFILCDLCREQLDTLQTRAKMAIALQVLRFIRSDELSNRLPEILALFRQLQDRRDDALAYLGTVLRYIAAVAGQVDRKTLEAAVRAALPTDMGEKAMPTIAESWIAEGRQEGHQERTCLLLRKLLVQRFGPLPEKIAQRIEQADQGKLDRWFDQALTASSLEEVFADF